MEVASQASWVLFPSWKILHTACWNTWSRRRVPETQSQIPISGKIGTAYNIHIHQGCLNQTRNNLNLDSLNHFYFKLCLPIKIYKFYTNHRIWWRLFTGWKPHCKFYGRSHTDYNLAALRIFVQNRNIVESNWARTSCFFFSFFSSQFLEMKSVIWLRNSSNHYNFFFVCFRELHQRFNGWSRLWSSIKAIKHIENAAVIIIQICWNIVRLKRRKRKKKKSDNVGNDKHFVAHLHQRIICLGGWLGGDVLKWSFEAAIK